MTSITSAKPLRTLRSRCFLAAGITLWVFGCDNVTPEATAIASDSAGIHLVRVIADPSAVSHWALDTLPVRLLTGMETGDETAFAFIGPVRFLSDGGLVVGDVASSRLLVYDAAGRFQRFLGQRGEGPGEMRRIESIAVGAGDTIGTFDPGLRRLSYWNPDSGFVRSVSLADDGSLESWPADAWPWHNSMLVVLQLAITPQDSVPPGTGVRRWPMRAHVTMRDSGGRVVMQSPTFPGMYTGLYERGDTRLPFSNRPFVALGRDRVYYGSGDGFELFALDASFKTTSMIRWQAREERLTSEEVERVRAEAIALISRRPLPPNPFAMNFAPEILPTNRPSIRRVFVDQAGRVWIERFEATRLGTAVQVPGNQWSIISADGEPIAILRLPPMTRLEDVRDDEVVVVRRDSLDVQTVAVVRLKR